MANLAQDVQNLQAAAAKAQALRAEADTALRVAKQRLADIDAELVKLGYTPENAEAEVTAREQALAVQIEQARVAIAAEVAGYNEILAAVR